MPLSRQFAASFLLWWTLITALVLGISIAVYAFAGAAFHATASTLTTCIGTSAIAGALITLLESRLRKGKRKS